MIYFFQESFTDKATVKDIYLTIKTRGPLAFDRFLASLRQSDHENLANTLEGKKITFRSSEVERNVNQNDNINDNHVEEEEASIEG